MTFTHLLSSIFLGQSTGRQGSVGLRLAIGLGQGALLIWLYYAAESSAWPATLPAGFGALLLIVLFVPVLAISALGHVRAWSLGVWLLVASGVSAVLGWHAMARLGEPVAAEAGLRLGWWALTPSGPVLWATALGFFVAQALLLAQAASPTGAHTSSFSLRPFWRPAPYAAYFDVAWKLALQVLLALLFVGVLWLILWLGSALFLLLGAKGLRNLLEKPWFYIAVTATAFSLTLHVTDVRANITASIRNLLLGLLSWLLPLAVLLVAGFLALLPLTGLAPLWATRHAGSALLSAVVVLVVLVNAVFQDGSAERLGPALLRVALRAACVLVLPITALALAALALRVQQYGWTSGRIVAGAILAVALVYALGYLWAVLSRTRVAARLGKTNLLAAYLSLALLLALSTPLADPARLVVQQQLARLASGAVTAQAFDYDYLRFQGERYGAAALAQLSQASGPDAAIMQAGAQAALRKPHPWSVGSPTRSRADIRANLRLWPQTASLPSEFLSQDWQGLARNQSVPACLTTQGQVCDVYVLDLDQDGRQEVLIQSVQDGLPIAVFQASSAAPRAKDEEHDARAPQEATGWRLVGTLSPVQLSCKRLRQALSQSEYRLLAPRFQDIEIQGQRLTLVPADAMGEACSR